MAENTESQHVLTPIHNSLVRPDLTFGCERNPLGLLGAVAISMIFIFGKPLTLVVGVMLLVLGIPFLRALARNDAYMTRVYFRHFNYKNYYEPDATLGRRPLSPNMREEL